MKIDTLIWGVGNPLYCDDQAGIKVSERLMENPPENSLVYTCYTVPGNYVCKVDLYRPRRLIIVDASDMGLSPGQFRRFSLDRIADVSFTSHDMPLDKMLERYDMEIVIIGIEPLIKDLGQAISNEVSQAIDEITDILRSNRVESIEVL